MSSRTTAEGSSRLTGEPAHEYPCAQQPSTERARAGTLGRVLDYRRYGTFSCFIDWTLQILENT